MQDLCYMSYLLSVLEPNEATSLGTSDIELGLTYRQVQHITQDDNLYILPSGLQLFGLKSVHQLAGRKSPATASSESQKKIVKRPHR
jgi:hypothetical protein